MTIERVKPRDPAYIDLGKDGSKWAHGYIPENAAAVALKNHKSPGGGSSRVTESVMAHSSADAHARIVKRHPGTTVHSVTDSHNGGTGRYDVTHSPGGGSDAATKADNDVVDKHHAKLRRIDDQQRRGEPITDYEHGYKEGATKAAAGNSNPEEYRGLNGGYGRGIREGMAGHNEAKAIERKQLAKHVADQDAKAPKVPDGYSSERTTNPQGRPLDIVKQGNQPRGSIEHNKDGSFTTYGDYRTTVGSTGKFDSLQAAHDHITGRRKTHDHSRVERAKTIDLAVLTAKSRADLATSDFAIPPNGYPIPDANHARVALALVAKNGSPSDVAKVKSAVHRRYPTIC